MVKASGMTKHSAKEEQELMAHIWSDKLKEDPLAFVMFAFPWGKRGTPLANMQGPRQWQIDELISIREHIQLNKQLISQGKHPMVYQLAISSGRGIGKSAFVAWINLWMMSCHLGSTCTITANTETQLRSKSMAEAFKWLTLLINSHWFDRTALSIMPSAWFKTAVESQLKIDTGYYYAKALAWSSENPDAFAGTHSYYGQMLTFDEACHDDQTDVLTDKGWLPWKDLDGSELLLTMNPVTHVASYQKPERLIRSHYTGKMYEYSPSKGSNFCVTPNHEMYYTTQDLRKINTFKKRKIQDFPNSNAYFLNSINWDGAERAHFNIGEKIIQMDLWLEFLGWYLAEGHLGFYKNNVRQVTITQKDTSVITRLSSIVSEMGYNPRVCETDIINTLSITDKELSVELLSYGRGQKIRRVPRYVADLSPRQIRIFLDAYREGDGYMHEKAEVVYTSCKEMSDDIQELYQKLGLRATVFLRSIEGQKKWIINHWATSSRDGYVVRVSHEKTMSKYKPSKVKLVDYEGEIFCAHVPPNHLLYTRRNGKALWSGNSGIDSAIWKVSEGFFTEPILHRYWLCFSNPRRATGEFFECFHRNRNYWKTRNIDSRSVEGIDVNHLQSIVDKYGEDSDEAKVEVKGLFPSQGESQFISRTLVVEAQQRELVPDAHAALMMGVDIARKGEDYSVIRFRQGRNGRIIPALKYKGRDNMQMANEIAHLITKYSPDAVCIDAGSGTGVIDRLKEMGYKVHEVWFGSKPDSEQWANKRIELWAHMRDWLEGACIDTDPMLAQDLTAPEYRFQGAGDKIVLESKEDMKKRGLASPDDGDALACTFAVKVPRKDSPNLRGGRGRQRFADDMDYKIF